MRDHDELQGLNDPREILVGDCGDFGRDDLYLHEQIAQTYLALVLIDHEGVLAERVAEPAQPRLHAGERVLRQRVLNLLPDERGHAPLDLRPDVYLFLREDKLVQYKVDDGADDRRGFAGRRPDEFSD